MGLISLSLFHLTSHAIFKSCLFISVGRVIHLSSSSQESRLTQGFNGVSAIRVIMLRLLCLRAAPFTSAYYSKERIILMSSQTSNSNYALIGRLRSIAQRISYEVRFAFLLIILIILTKDFNLSSIKSLQSDTIILFVSPMLVGC